MPQVGWVIDGKKYTFAEAEQLAKKDGAVGGFIYPILNVMREQKRWPGVISPSMAGGCLRQAFLRFQEDYYIDPQSVFTPGIGTAMHEWLMLSEDYSDVMKEDRLWTSVEASSGRVYKLSGQIDRFEIDRKTLYDFKTTGTLYRKYPPSYQHVLQQNLYVYLLRKHGYEVERAFLWYVVPKTIRRKQEDGSYKQEVDAKLVPVPIWDIEEQEAKVLELADRIDHIITTNELPAAYGEEDEDIWRCNYCPVAAQCAELVLNELEEV